MTAAFSAHGCIGQSCHGGIEAGCREVEIEFYGVGGYFVHTSGAHHVKGLERVGPTGSELSHPDGYYRPLELR